MRYAPTAAIRFAVCCLSILCGAFAGDRGVATAQERLNSSTLAGVEFSEPSWDWSDDEGGSKAEAIRAAAAVVERSCGNTEFHAWQTADQASADATRATVGGDFERAGWEIEPAAFDEAGQSIHLARNSGREIVIQWLRIPDQDALALFLCEAQAGSAASAAEALPAEPAPDASEEEDGGGVAFLVGIALALGAVGFGFIWNTLRHRRQATAAAGWPVAAATILSGEVVVESHTDSDGDTTTSYVPRVRYGYAVEGQRYEGTRISFGGAHFSSRAGAQAVLDRYPAGSATEVRYDSADPSKATLEIERPGVWKIVFGAVFLALTALILLVALLIYRGA